MKALKTLIFIAVLSVSFTLSAQIKLPGFHEPGSLNDGRYLRQPLKSPVKQLMTTDSLTQCEIQSGLNHSLPKNGRYEVPKDANLQTSPGRIPANPKDYFKYIDLNGNKLYKPKSSLGLIVY